MNQKSELFVYFCTSLAAISFASLLFGIITGANSSKCKYESIASRINIPYVVGCELFEPRFKK